MNSQMPLISVITVSYNNRDGLCRTIDSVNCQRDRNLIQHIVVDGNSIDGGEKVLMSVSSTP